MIGIAAADLGREGESIGVTGLGEQLLRLVRSVAEQLLDALGHALQGLEVLTEIRVLGIGHEFRVTAVVGIENFLLVHSQVQCAAHTDVIKRGLVHPHRQEGANVGQGLLPLQLGCGFLEVVHDNPTNDLEDIDLRRTQGGELGCLVLDDAVVERVDKGDGVALLADTFLVPVTRVLLVVVQVALNVVLKGEWTGTHHVSPVVAVDVSGLPGHDLVVVAVAVLVGPLGMEFPEFVNHGIAVPGVHLAEVLEVAGYFLGAVFYQLVTEHYVIGDKFPRLHDAGFLREHDAPAQVHHQLEAAVLVFFPLPAFGQFATQ